MAQMKKTTQMFWKSFCILQLAVSHCHPLALLQAQHSLFYMMTISHFPKANTWLAGHFDRNCAAATVVIVFAAASYTDALVLEGRALITRWKKSLNNTTMKCLRMHLATCHRNVDYVEMLKLWLRQRWKWDATNKLCNGIFSKKQGR